MKFISKITIFLRKLWRNFVTSSSEVYALNYIEREKKKERIDMEKVFLYRFHSDEKQTLGVVVHDRDGDVFVCKSLELAWRENQKNISCIPADEYIVRWTYSPRFRRFMYLVTEVDNRSGIRIHAGTYFIDIKGCILFGSALKDLNLDSKLDIIHSGDTIRQFERRMNEKSFVLIIKDVYRQSENDA